MRGFNKNVYRDILRVRDAYVFDIGGLLMRIYTYMATIGTISMMTLAGYSFFIAGTVSSAIALATFFISPRVSKFIDKKGQSVVIPKATAITLAGLTLMLATVSFGGPVALCYIAAVLMGFLPSAPAITRTRWTYLVRTGKLGEKSPTLKTVFSYEGVIDDIAFMIGPALSIALAASLFPSAGMLVGGVFFLVGSCMLTLSRSTEPEPGWGINDTVSKSRRSVIALVPSLRVLFTLMLFLGAFYGVFDTATVSFAEDISKPTVASFILIVASCVSIVSGFVFGMILIFARQYKQLAVVSLLIGCAYGSMFLINSIESLFIVSTIAALFYAPFIITVNATCEQMVPNNRLTESITWLTSGSTCGLAFGPTLGGIVIDLWGTTASFSFGAVLAIMIPVIAFACIPILKKSGSKPL